MFTKRIFVICLILSFFTLPQCATHYWAVSEPSKNNKVLVVGAKQNSPWTFAPRIWEIDLKTGVKKEMEVEYK